MAEDGADPFPELRSVYRGSGFKNNLSNSKWLESISNGSASRPCQNSAPNAWRNPNVIEKLKLVKRVNGEKGVTNNNHQQDKSNSASPEDNSLGTFCLEGEALEGEVLEGEVLEGEVLEGEVLEGEALEGEVLHDNNSSQPLTARGNPDLNFEMRSYQEMGQQQKEEMDSGFHQIQVIHMQLESEREKIIKIHEEKKLALWQKWQKMVIEFEKMVLQLDQELENELKQHMDKYPSMNGC